MKDLLLNENGDLLIEGGDFNTGTATLQNQALILAAQEGEFKASPEIGVGISNFLLSEQLLEFRHRIKAHFAMDGLIVEKLEMYDLNNLQIIADYE